MANLMSGIFDFGRPNSASNAMANARYGQELKDYQSDKDAFEQGEALDRIRSFAGEASKNFTPERKGMVNLSLEMMANRATNAKGNELFNNMFKQRGTTVADIIKQRTGVTSANLKHQYKVDNPIPDPVPSKWKVYENYSKLKTEGEKADFRDTIRDRQLINLKDRFRDVHSGDEVMLNLVEAGVKEKQAITIEDRLTNFWPDINATESFLNQNQNQRDDIKQLYETTNKWTTSWGALGKFIPGSDSKEWAELKSTVISNIALDKLIDMKSSSSQGASGLGALSDQERVMLQNHMGSLEQANSPAELKRVLKRIDRDLATFQNRRMASLKRNLKWHNQRRHYLGYEKGEDVEIPEYLQHLFGENNTYERPPNLSTLGGGVPIDLGGKEVQIGSEGNLQPTGTYNPETGMIEWQ